jgi:hypothetical protein
MVKPCLNDLRARVVNDITEGATLAETADHHHASLSTPIHKYDDVFFAVVWATGRRDF